MQSQLPLLRSYLVKHSLSSSQRRLFLPHTAPGRRPPVTAPSLPQRIPSPLPAVQVKQDCPLAKVAVFVFDALVDMLAKALPDGVPVDADVGVARYRCPANRGGYVQLRQTGRVTENILVCRERVDTCATGVVRVSTGGLEMLKRADSDIDR